MGDVMQGIESGDLEQSRKDAINNDAHQLPSGTVTFLFTDIEGSTQLLERLREQYAQLLAEHHQLLRDIFKSWKGYEIDTQGDSFFVAFSKAADAISCAINAQNSLHHYHWPHGEIVRVRMGLHTGEPIVAQTGYVGMDVHRAARIASVGYGGQVLLSQTTRDLIYTSLPPGTRLRDLGVHMLKNINFPQEIYQLEIPGLLNDFPPLMSLDKLEKEEEPPAPGKSPYMGLQYFDETDAEWFFGRQEITLRLIEAVSSHRFTAVIGASGSGKSSVVRAGLIPQMKSLAYPSWQVKVITPSTHPLESLAICLTKESESVTATSTLIDDMQNDHRSLHLYCQKNLLTNKATRILLIIDQFEELFTLCRSESERQAFVNNILYTANSRQGALTSLITLRADFYEYLAQYAELRELVSSQQIYIGLMNSSELRQAIEEPAKRGGWEFSPGLVELILSDLGVTENRQPEPGLLPLLSHALLETWKRRRGNLLNLKAYSEAGGVRGAIARTAETVFYRDLSPAQQAIAKGIFLRLTEFGEGTQDTRRRISISELIPPGPAVDTEQIREVLVKLADARLIITGESTVEVAHEALIREWPTLRDWLSANREGLRIHRHLTEATQEWELMENDPGALYRGTRLSQAMDWAMANPRSLNAGEQSFLEASRQAAEREQQEQENQRLRELETAKKFAEIEHQRAEAQIFFTKRLKLRAWLLAGAMIVALLLAGAAITFGIQAQQQTKMSRASEWTMASISNLTIDPQRSILLAMQAVKTSDTPESRNALHRAILSSRLRDNLMGHSDVVFGVAFHPDGTHFATASLDGTIKLWTLDELHQKINSTPVLTITNPVDRSVKTFSSGHMLEYSPNGNLLASISASHDISIWESGSGKKLQTLAAQSGILTCLAFSTDGQLLVAGGTDNLVHVWDVNTGEELQTLAHDALIMDVAFSPGGKYLATIENQNPDILIWEKTGLVQSVFSFSFRFNSKLDSPHRVIFSPDGKQVSSGMFSDTVFDFSAASPGADPVLLFHLNGHTNGTMGFEYSSDGANIVTASADGTIKIWDATTGQERFTLLANAGSPMSIDLAPNGKDLLSTYADGTIKLWDLSPSGTQEWLTIVPPDPGIINNLQFVRDRTIMRMTSPDGKYFAVTSGKDDPVHIYELSPSPGTEVRSIQTDPGRFAASTDQNFNRLVIYYVETNTIKVTDLASGDLIKTIQLDSIPVDFLARALSPDGSLLAIGCKGGTMVWDLASGIKLYTLEGTKQDMCVIEFSPDGTQVARTSQDGVIQIWDALQGNPLQQLAGSMDLPGFAFSPDGKQLLATRGKEAILYDLQTGLPILTLTGHTAPAAWPAFSSDGQIIGVGGSDGAIIYDAANGQELLRLPGYSVKFLPGNKHLLAGITDGNTIVIYGFYLDIDNLMLLAQTRLMRSWTTDECQNFLHMETCPQTP